MKLKSVLFIYRYYKNYKADLILVGNIARPVNKQFFKVEFKKKIFFYTSRGSILDQGVEGEAYETWMVFKLSF